MEKITIQPGESVDINGAIIGMEIVDKLLSLQLGIDSPGNPPREQNIGIKEDMGSYRDVIMFLASEADSISEKEKLAQWLTGITIMMNVWNSFRVPGTKDVKLW